MSENKRRKKNLLDDEDAEADGATDLGIRVNKEYAARFEHNKRREELHRLQAKYPEEADKLARKIAREAAIAAGQEPPPLGDDDSSEDEEEDDGEIPVDTEAKIFETLMRIRRKDPAIYQKDVKFFDDEGEEGQGGGGGEEEEGGSKKPKSAKAKPVFLKDLIAKQALEYGPGGDSSDEEEQGGGAKREGVRKPKAYDAEQEDLRKAFLEAAEDAVVAEAEEGPGGVLRLRAREEASGGEESEESEEQEAEPEAKRKKGGQKGEGQGQFQQLIEAYFGSEGELHPDDKFLKEYIMNKGWVDRDDDYVPSYREVVGEEEEEEEDGGAGVDDEEDEAYLRQMDAFEAKYNFRFEEPGADRIVTHPRVVEGTIRKPDDKRKRQRDAKKQRLEEAEEAAREEVKRLKNLKKQEIESKLDKLRNVAGAAAPTAASLDDVLEGDFDPEEWDKKMAAAFDDDYYDAEEELEGLQEDLNLLGSDMEDSSEEEEAEGSGDGGEDGEGEKPVRFSTLRKKLKEVDALSEEPEGEEEGKKRKADPEMAARQRAELQRLLEEYYKLDYEDNVGGIKTRFKYREVPASTFGLSVDDILRLDDKSLNQVAGMKRLAPYREDIEKQRPNYKALEMIKGEKAQLKQHRRQHWKKDRQKFRDGGRQGGQREKAAEAGEAAGVGPGSAAADGSGDAAAGQQRSGDARKEDRKDRKATQRSRDGGEKAGPGPGSQAAGAAKGGRGGKKQQGGKPQGKEREQRQVDPAQARLASYAVPTLKKDSGWARDGQGLAGKKRTRDDKQQGKQSGGTAEPSDGPQMSRAQKKNLKRTMKRAEKRQAGPADA